jgi:transcriptional regulator with XRE-family HTH domain
MATILAPQFGREVLRCNRCDLVQFATPKMFCRRCRQPYDWECAIEAEQTENIRNRESIPQTDSIRDRIAFNVLNLRQLNGFTQRDVGLRMGVPRTYISKIEGRKVTPNLSSLDRLARVLGTSVVALVSTPLDPGDKYPSECLRDPFLGQMSRFAGRLTPAQRTRVLDCARRLIEDRKQKHPVRTIPSCEEEQCFSTHCCSTSSQDAALKTSTRF